jgi:glycosyltransferase involved in cell wall biosynthesis
MLHGRRIAVVVPAYNEADKIARTLRSIPGFVDHAVLVDDASADGTGRVAARSGRRGLEILAHGENRGVGAAIATGYARAFELGADVTAVMAGDSQMDPADLPALLAPVLAGEADYAKGNRFLWPGGWRGMPLVRLLGNVALSLATRVASGYADSFDSQCGYTAANRRALAVLLAEPLFPRYGYPNDVLVRLGAEGVRVRDVPVRPVYGPGWRSGLRPSRVVLPISRLLLRGAAARARRALIPGRRPAELRSARPS